MKKINWKTWTSVIVVALVIILVAQYIAIMPPQINEISQAIDIVPEQELPAVITTPPTGDVNDAINAILDSVTEEQAFFTDEEKDTALLGADSQAINDFGQSFNENEL